MTTQQDSVDVERARLAAFHAIYGSKADPFALPESYDYASEVADAVLAALSLPITQRDEQGDQAHQEAIEAGLREWQQESFNSGVITRTMAREMATCILRQPAFIRRLSIEQGDKDGGEG